MFNGKYLDWNQKRIKGIIDQYGPTYMFQKKVLDLGAGHCDIGGALYRLGADVTAVDIRQEHLKIINKKFPGIKTQKNDLDSKWPFIGKQFDIVLNLDLICHLLDFENHLKAVCSSANHLVLETAVCDSEDPYKNILVNENKNIYDLSGNGQGCRPSPAAIERILTECGFTFSRLDNAKFNSGDYTYNWIPKNNNHHSPNQRRIWFATKNNTAKKSPSNQITPSPKAFNLSSRITTPQIIQSTFNSPTISNYIPFKSGKKPKVALCISGHLRTFDSNYPSVKTNILDKLDCDVFIHTWDILGLSYRSGDSNLYNTQTSRALDIINKLYNPKKIVIEKSKKFNVTPLMQKHAGFRDIDGMLSMFYKIEECNKLKREYEKENGFKYDFEIRFRGDLWMEQPIPITDSTNIHHLYLPLYGNFGGACDQFAFGGSSVMDQFSEAYSFLERYFNAGAPVNPEKVLQYHIDICKIPVSKVPVKFLIRRANGLVQDNMLLERAWGMVK